LDPGWGFKLCEAPCGTTADCLPLDTYCGGTGTCATNFCNTTFAQQPAQSAFGEFCNAAGSADGYCDEQSSVVAGNTLFYGVCVQSGTVINEIFSNNSYTYYACSPTADRSDLGSACVNRGTCQPCGFGGDCCYEECDPVGSVSSSNCLTPYTLCASMSEIGMGELPPLDYNSPHDGLCVPCDQDQASCTTGGGCCSQVCGSNNTCCELSGGGCNVDADCCTTTCNQTYGQCN
jgi:hypothetical protein